MGNKNTYKILAILLVISVIIPLSAWPQNDEWQERPILLGTSGSNINDISKLYCCTGTLGALVQDINNIQYILSNNHVLAKTNRGRTGDAIIQPGLADQSPGCYKDLNDAVANLSRFVTISFKKGKTNKVDAAIARVIDGKVDSSGSILGIGEISNLIITEPAIGMSVKKSGRTTGLTQGVINSLNVTVDVIYNKECGIGSQKARFINQIMIGPPGFSAGGDSGSLIVENPSPYPGAVGLLFAGSSAVTVANPISDVLSLLSVSMVGGGTGGTFMTAQTKLSSEEHKKAVKEAAKIKERHEKAILDIEGTVGMGIGLSETVPGQVFFEVYTKKPAHEMKHLIPENLEGIPVDIVETGEIIAYCLN